MRSSALTRLALVAAAGAACAVGSGCRGERSDKPPRQFLPDMDDQPKYKAQGESTFFRDGRAMREPVPGTVAFGTRAELDWGATEEAREASRRLTAEARQDMLGADSAFYTGKGPDGVLVATIPVDVTESLIRRGQERFNIYCTPCHGYLGDGQGMVGQQWSYVLPSFHEPKFQRGSDDPDHRGNDGFYFWTIMHGVPNAPGTQPPLKMPSYADRVSVRDAWAITAYIRALQRSRSYPAAQVPEALRPELDRTRGRGPAPGQQSPPPSPQPSMPQSSAAEEGS